MKLQRERERVGFGLKPEAVVVTEKEMSERESWAYENWE